MNLELDSFVQHGHVIEVIGKTEVGARVMVNGREVPLVGTDGSFPLLHSSAAGRRKCHHHYRAKLARGSQYPTEKGHGSMRKNLCHVFFPRGTNFRLQYLSEESNRIRETAAKPTAITG